MTAKKKTTTKKTVSKKAATQKVEIVEQLPESFELSGGCRASLRFPKGYKVPRNYRMGVLGLAGSGKDEVGTRLSHVQMKLATPLKKMLAGLMGCNLRQIEDQAFKATPQKVLGGKTPRDLLIDIGDLMRGYNADVFVDLMKLEGNTTIACTDVRRDNELTGYDIYVLVVREGVKRITNHPTEGEAIDTLLKNKDLPLIIIHNDGTMRDLSIGCERLRREVLS